MARLGVVSYLNSKPLIAGLVDARPDLAIRFAVPAALEPLLAAGEVDVALLPIVDVLRSNGRYRLLGDSCIACDGETMTVRVFSQAPPDRIRRLCGDIDSHTSVTLARVLWRELYDRDLELVPLDARETDFADEQAVLLIGDKVVDAKRASFAYEVDLGGAWRAHTGLPFVFAAWAFDSARHDETALQPVAAALSAARDRGVATAAEIAREQGPALHWPESLAVRYLARCLKFKLDARFVEGANLFARLCGQYGLAQPDAELAWPAALAAPEKISR